MKAMEDPELEKIRKKKIQQIMISRKKKQEAKKMKVKVYSTQTCPYCDMAKQYLQSKGVEFVEVDVSRDHAAATEMVQKSGQRGVPQIEIGEKMIVGFNRPAIDAALEGQ